MQTVNNIDFTNLVAGVNNRGKVDAVRIPQPTENEIVDFENLLGDSLPRYYRDFLSGYSGGRYNPKITRYLCFDVGPSLAGVDSPPVEVQGLDYFFTLNEEFLNGRGLPGAVLGLKSSLLAFRTMEDDEYPHIPWDFFPIGLVPSEGNWFFLGFRGPHRGKVVFYDAQRDPDEPLDNVYLIAETFEDFLKCIYPCQ